MKHHVLIYIHKFEAIMKNSYTLNPKIIFEALNLDNMKVFVIQFNY